MPGAASATVTAARIVSRARTRDGRTITSHSLRSLLSTDGSTGAFRRALLEQLLEARCAFERGEARGAFRPLIAPAPHDATPPSSRDRRRSPDEAAQDEVPRSPRSPLRVHGTIVPCASRRSVTYCSTLSSSSRNR